VEKIRSFFRGMRIFLPAVLGIVIFAPVVYSQVNNTESLTITTYYPSPYGVYRDLEIHRSVKYRPLADLSTSTVADPTEGQLVYLNNTTSQGFYYYNGASWQAQSSGSSGGTIMTLFCPWGSDYTAGVGNGWGNQCGANGLSCCTPPACPSGWTSAATYPEVISIGCSGSESACLWSSADFHHPAAAGRVVRICVKN